MELAVGDKVRVHFYPSKTTRSFVEGIVDRNKIDIFRGLSFSLQTTREVVLGHEIPTPRSLPYIIAYAKEDDFEGRIEVLEAAIQPASEPRIKAEPEFTEEPGPVHDAHAEVESEPEKRGLRRLFNRAPSRHDNAAVRRSAHTAKAEIRIRSVLYQRTNPLAREGAFQG